MTVLVTGGAGYIGSHMLLELPDAVAYDDLRTGHLAAIPMLVERYVPKTSADVRDTLNTLFHEHKIETIMHFAASTSVEQSMKDPISYYVNNVEFTRLLLEMAASYQVKHFIYSSTAAVYGNPLVDELVDEKHPTNPMSPYGGSKLAGELLVKDAARAHGFRYGILRYFNVAGADPKGRAWDRREDPKHLIGAVVKAMRGEDVPIEVYGTDYDTEDGSAERDFVHVMDVVGAHKTVLQHFERGGSNVTANVGYGDLYSILEVIRVAEEVSGKNLHVDKKERRKGDIPKVGANPERLQLCLGWQPQYQDLKTILTHAYEYNHVKASEPGVV